MSAVNKTAKKSTVKTPRPEKGDREAATVIVSRRIDVGVGRLTLSGPVHDVVDLARMRAACGRRLWGWAIVERAELGALQRCGDCVAA